MSFFAAFLAFSMSYFFHTSPECRHGVHMHVIWNNPSCQEQAGQHTLVQNGPVIGVSGRPGTGLR